MKSFVRKAVEVLMVAAMLVGMVVATSAELTPVTALIMGVCGGIVLGVLKWGPPIDDEAELATRCESQVAQ